MHFGSDGKLYVGVGENADAALAQNLASPFGKLLRFNEDGTIPTDNPYYATQSGLARAVWASGLRNPFTFAVQPGTGRIHINDVGQDTWEEINLGVAGANYGWPSSEGPEQHRRRHHRAAVRLSAQRHQPARLGPGRLLHGLRDRRRRFLSGERSVPDRLPRPVLFRRFRQQVRRPTRQRQRQRRLLVRQALGLAGRPAGGHRRRGLRADAQRRHAHQRTLKRLGAAAPRSRARRPGSSASRRRDLRPASTRAPSSGRVRSSGPEICQCRPSAKPYRVARHRNMNRSTYLPLRNLPVLVLVVLVACGGGGDGSIGTPPPMSARADGDADRAGEPPFALAGMVAVTATASDDVAVTGVEFQIDGVTIGAVDTPRRMPPPSTPASTPAASTCCARGRATPRATSPPGRRRWCSSAAACRSRAASPATRPGSPASRVRPRSRRRPTAGSSSPSRRARSA